MKPDGDSSNGNEHGVPVPAIIKNRTPILFLKRRKILPGHYICIISSRIFLSEFVPELMSKKAITFCSVIR